MFLRKNKYLVYLTLIILGFLLRMYYANYESYWFDEQISFFVANPEISFKETLVRSYTTDLSPVFYNLILKYYFTVFSYSPDLGRYLSTVSGILGVIFLCLISYQISKYKSLILTLFLASFNIYLITYSAETRPYSTIFFLSSLNIFLFVKCFILKSKNKLLSFTFFVISILTLLIHPFTILIIGSQVLFILFKDWDYKKISTNIYFFYTLVILFFVFIGYENLKIAFSFQPPEFFIKNPDLSFFTNLYFSQFFGSKIMGIIYLLIFFFLFLKNFNIILKNDIFFFLSILFFSTIIVPILYGYIFNPILKDRYIIFILIPIILLISNLIYDLKKIHLRKFLIFTIIISTVVNQFFEIYNKSHEKPDYVKIVDELNKSPTKYVSIIAMDKIHPFMTDVKKKDPFRERHIVENYIANLDKLNKKILIIDQDKIGEEINEILLICQVPMVDDCDKNIRITKKLKIEKKLSFYNLKTYLLKK